MILRKKFWFKIVIISENRSLNLSAFVVAWDLKLGDDKRFALKKRYISIYVRVINALQNFCMAAIEGSNFRKLHRYMNIVQFTPEKSNNLLC